MATEYKAMKVVLRTNPENGKVLAPPFATLQIIIDSGLKPNIYIDKNSANGVKLDQTSSRSDDSPHSPLGTQVALIIGLPAFVDAAVSLPDCDYLPPATAATQWGLRITPYEAEEKLNLNVLTALAHKTTLGIPLTTLQNAALDVDTDIIGITKNHHKVLTDLAVKKGFTLI